MVTFHAYKKNSNRLSLAKLKLKCKKTAILNKPSVDNDDQHIDDIDHYKIENGTLKGYGIEEDNSSYFNFMDDINVDNDDIDSYINSDDIYKNNSSDDDDQDSDINSDTVCKNNSHDKNIILDEDKEDDYMFLVQNDEIVLDDIHSKYVTMSLKNIENEVTKYVAVLDSYGLTSHFTSAAGGKFSTKRINAISRRLCGCDHWIYNLRDPPVERLRGNYSEFNENSFMRYVKCFITRDYVLLSSYSAYCEKYSGLKSSTTKGIVTEIYAGVKWFILFKNTSKFHVQHNRTSGIDETVKGLQRCLSKDVNKNRPDATLSQVTYDLKLPEGTSSLEQLQNLQIHLQDQVPLINRIMNLFMNENVISQKDYVLFMRILYASLYIFTVQGRIGGVESVLYKDGHALLNDNYALTNKFKTQSTFGKQPILLGDLSKELFSLYFHHLRPYIVHQNSIKENHFDAPMWLSFDGRQQKHIGQQMSNYFIQTLNLNITTNGLRSLVETLCDGLHR
jgi:hypothetical protein